MQITIKIHPSWYGHREDLADFMAALVVVEGEYHPGRRSAGPDPPGRGDAWEPPDEEPAPPRAGRRNGAHPSSLNPHPSEEEEESPPTDGRQLLGWAAKQKPDLKGRIMAFGKKKGYPSKIVSWDSAEVEAAYEHARKALAQQWGGRPS